MFALMLRRSTTLGYLFRTQIEVNFHTLFFMSYLDMDLKLESFF
jgi:hypothetical protein